MYADRKQNPYWSLLPVPDHLKEPDIQGQIISDQLQRSDG